MRLVMLMESLAGVSEPGRLAEVGEWVIECEDGASLLARMAE